MNFIERVKEWARASKRETVALWFASRDPRTPWTARALAVCAVAYALSPIDLIPDFIPVLGFVADAILLPGLIWLTLRLLPDDVIKESRADCRRQRQVGELGCPRLLRRHLARSRLLGVAPVVEVTYMARRLNDRILAPPTGSLGPTSIRARLITVSLLTALATAPWPALAIPDDFRVLGDDIAGRGEFGLEFQTAAGRSRPRGGGPRSSERQGLAEFSYGIATGMEVSAQFPVVLRDGSWRANGLNLEAQYVAQHDDEGVYRGARFELGRSGAALAADSRDSVEVRPILGFRHAGWEAIFNASARRELGGSTSRWTLEPSMKISAQAGAGVRLGVEGYSIASREAALGAPGRSSIALLAIDARWAKLRINVGAGRSWGAERGGPIVKTVLGFDLD